MIGEGLRELGVLSATFIPLDYAFAENPDLPGWAIVVATVMFGGGFFCVGILIEEKRQ